MFSIHRSSIAGLIAGLLVLCTTACGGKDEPAATPPAEPEAKTAAPEVEAPQAAATEEGEIRYTGETPAGEKFMAQIGGEISLPSGLPSDLPIYPNSVPYSAMELSNYTLVSFESFAPAAQVYRFYSENLPTAGWNIDNEINMGGQRILKASKGGQEAEVRIEATEDGARISVVVQ